MFITLMQISQMFIGVGITVASALYSRDPESCGVVRRLIPWCCAMYSTYLYFFVAFFVERFFASPPAHKATPAASKQAATAHGQNGKKSD